MQENDQILDKASKVVIAVFVSAFLTGTAVALVKLNQQDKETTKKAQIVKQKADSMSQKAKVINFFQKTK